MDPILADLVDYRTGLSMLHEGRADEAIQLLQRARATNPNDANVPNALGLALLYKKDYPAALKAFAEALKMDPSFVEARNNRGVTLMEAGKLDEAEKDFDAILQGPPSTGKVNAHYNMGLLHKKRGRWAEAETEFSLVLADSAQNTGAFRERGLARTMRDDFRGALEDFLAVLKIDPKDSVASYQAALCLIARGRRDLASKYMELTIQSAPESEEGRKARRFLESEPAPAGREERR